MIQPASVLFSNGDLFNESSGPYHSLRQTVRALVQQQQAVTVVGTRGVNDNVVSDWSGNVFAFERRGPYSLHYAPELAGWLRSQSGSWDVVSMQGVWMHTNRAVADWCIRNDRPYMITAHGNFNPAALRISAWKKWLACRTFMKLVFDHVSCYQALTEIEYRTLRQYGIRRPICVIGNGIELPKAESMIQISGIIPEKYLGRRTCLYLGRLFHIKGVDRLIRTWARISPTDDWQLIIAGSGEAKYVAELQRLAKESGCRNVFFVGHVSGLVKAAWFRQAAITVLPSHSEAFPMAVLEAFAYGCPAVLTNTCGLPAAAKVGAALEVDSSELGIADGLAAMLLLSTESLETMGEHARDFVRTQYTWEIITGQLNAVYQWLRFGGAVPDCVRLN